MNLSTRQLIAFLEISRLQSFARAAEQIHLSPSGMSMLVKELEEQVGARLFHRTTRAVSLTEAGKRLEPVAERILQDLRGLESVIEGTQDAVRQQLQIAATPMVCASLMPTVIRDFASVYPQVRVSIADLDVSQVRRSVLEDEADIGFGFFVKPAVGLVRHPLCKFPLMSIRPANGNKPGLQSSKPWNRLAKIPLVSLPAENPIQAVIEKHLTNVGQASGDRLRFNLIGTIIAMVRAGHGHAVIPSFALEECLRQGLVISMLHDPVVHIELYLVSRRGKKPSPAAMAFAEVIRIAAVKLAV